MSNEQLTGEALALPLPERVALAQSLWQSIDADFEDDDDQGVLSLAVRRDDELSSGKVAGRSHEDVMNSARRALGCD